MRRVVCDANDAGAPYMVQHARRRKDQIQKIFIDHTFVRHTLPVCFVIHTISFLDVFIKKCIFFEGVEIFYGVYTPTPTLLVKRMCELAQVRISGDIILDFFASSGSTDDAIWQLNKAGLDLGFRVLRFTAGNNQPWDTEFDALEGTLLRSIGYIKHDRTEHGVPYGMFLKYGLDLSVSIETKTIKGKKVHIIGTLDVVEGIAALIKLKPEVMRVIFRDAEFNDDVVKTNTVQILRQTGIDDVKSI